MDKAATKAQAVDISVVTPVYNEEARIEEFCRRVRKVLGDSGRSFEIVAVDDASRDKSPQIMRDISRQIPEMRPIFMARNRGQALALAAGIQASRGEYVVIMDSDLQHLPEDIPKLLVEMDKGYDLVSGGRVNRKESLFLRRLPSKAANAMIRLATGCQVKDMGGLQGVRGPVIRSVHIRPGQHRFLPALIYLLGGSVSEVPISAPPRQVGQSNYGIERVLEVGIDLLLLWFLGSARSRPLYLLGRISVFIFVFAALLYGYVFTEKVFWGIPMGTRPPLIISGVLTILSLITFLGAITLELLSEMLNRVAGHKGYLLKKNPLRKETTSRPGDQGNE